MGKHTVEKICYISIKVAILTTARFPHDEKCHDDGKREKEREDSFQFSVWTGGLKPNFLSSSPAHHTLSTGSNRPGSIRPSSVAEALIVPAGRRSGGGEI